MISFAAKEIYLMLNKVKFYRPKELTFKAPVILGPRVLCRALEITDMTNSGFQLSDKLIETYEKFNQIAVVEAAPEGSPVIKGDYVVLPKYIADEIYLKGERLLSVFLDQIVMWIQNPEEVINFVVEEDIIEEGLKDEA